MAIMKLLSVSLLFALMQTKSAFAKDDEDKKKKNPDLYVGVHVRRSDYQKYEMIRKLKPLKASYYLEAMELYRQYYKDKKFAFMIISDDIEWCKKHLKKKAKDVFYASNPKMSLHDGIGHDLALMSKCNHTISSRGSFSYWASVFSGWGAKVLPCHFPAYQDLEVNFPDICYRHPLQEPIKRFYPFTN